MRAWIARWPWQAEMAAVLGIVFGPALAGAIESLLRNSAQPPITSVGLVSLLILEPTLAAAALGILYLRGWSWSSIGLRPGARSTVEGLLLALVAWMAYVVLFRMAWALLPIDPRSWAKPLVAHGITPTLALVVSIVNPLFEETFVAGYIISSFKQRGHPWLGIHLSTGLRLAYHVYQGPIAILSILPLGLIFAVWYGRTGRLWPLVVAHALFDFVPLMADR